MAPLSLTAKRILAGLYLALLCLSAASYYLNWGIFGAYDKKALAAIVFCGLLMLHRYGPGLLEEVRAYRASDR